MAKPGRSLHVGWHVAILAIVLAACGGGPAPSGSPASPGTSAPVGPAGPGQSGGPTASGAPGALPQPTLAEAAAIGAALLDPDRVDIGVVSLVAALGIAVDADDGNPLRPGDPAIFPDFHLRESEVRGLIEMGKADATRMRAGHVPWTLADLHAALGPHLPGLTQDQLTGIYVDAYRAAPGDFVRGVIDGLPLLPTTAFSRVHLWLLLVDGVLGREGPAARAAGVARAGGVALAAYGGSAGHRAAAGPLAHVAMPFIPSPIPGLDARDFAVLLGRLPTLGYTIPLTITASPTTAHEGHGGPGPTVIIEATAIDVQGPVLSPIDGRVLLAPLTSGLAGVPIAFAATDAATLAAHGSLPPTFGIPSMTDAVGAVRTTYALRTEPANGVGSPMAAPVLLEAVVDLRQLLQQRYVVDPLVLSVVWGERRASTLLTIEWHEEAATPGPSGQGAWSVVLTGPRSGAGSFSGTGLVLCAAPTIDGQQLWTGTYVDTAGAGASGISSIDVSQGAGGRHTISVGAVGGIETGTWLFGAGLAGSSATVTSSGQPGGPVQLTGDGSYTDTEGRVFTVHATLTCSETFT